MNFRQNTGKSIQQAFEEFHTRNPDVFEEFIEFATSAIKKGKKRISAKLIISVIRWYKFMRTDEPTMVNHAGRLVSFKINDAYSSRYARLFIQHYPQYEEYFEMRELRA